jgi:hypothetical protein
MSIVLSPVGKYSKGRTKKVGLERMRAKKAKMIRAKKKKERKERKKRK